MSQIFRYGVPLLLFMLFRRVKEGNRRRGAGMTFPAQPPRTLQRTPY
jgi:hypothetical protein